MKGPLGQGVGPYLLVSGWISEFWRDRKKVCLGLREPSLEPFEFESVARALDLARSFESL